VHWCGQHRGIIQLLQFLRAAAERRLPKSVHYDCRRLRFLPVRDAPHDRDPPQQSLPLGQQGLSRPREKPFFNICKFRVNVATRATDLDTKDVQIESTRPGNGYAASFVLNLKNRNWTKDTSFARFLNQMGQPRAKYGGVLVKKTEQGSELRLTGMAWRDMIADQVEVRSGSWPCKNAAGRRLD
jgi:hypothetical protein